MAQKFTRTTKGRNQQVVIPKAAAVSTDATLALFLANAASGVIGVYDANDALHTNAIVAGESFYIVQKNSNGSLRKTNMVAWNDVTVRRKAYVAPVKAIGSLGFSGTAGALNLATAVAVGKLYEFAIFETTEGNQPFPTWNYEYQAIPNDVEYNVLSGLAKKVNDSTNLIYKANKPLVTAKVKVDGTYANYTTTGTYTVTNGNTLVAMTLAATDPAVGDLIAFDAAAAPTDAIGDVYKVTALSAGVSFTLDRPYAGATQTFIAAEASGTRVKKVTAYVNGGLEFTGINDNEHFRISTRQELQYATIVNLSSYTRGNGTYTEIMELELEGNTFAGNTAGNTLFGNEAYGNPDKWVVLTTETYDTFNIQASQQLVLTGDVSFGKANLNITIAAPKSTGGISASLNTLFGT